MKEENFKYITKKLKERAFYCWSDAIAKSREADTKAGTQYMGYTVRGVTNPHHEGFSDARLEDLSDILAVLSRNEEREEFVNAFLGAADHFFRQEDGVLRKLDEDEKALAVINKMLDTSDPSEKSFINALERLNGLDILEGLYKSKLDLEKLVVSSREIIGRQRAFNRLNDYSEGNVGQGNKEAIIRLYNFFVNVLSKWESREGRRKVIEDDFLNDLEQEYFIDFLFKDEHIEDVPEAAVKVPAKLSGGNRKGVTLAVFKLIYQVVDSLGITHVGAETIAKVINERSEVEIPERILVKADDTVWRIELAEEEAARAAEPYILFPDGTEMPG